MHYTPTFRGQARPKHKKSQNFVWSRVLICSIGYEQWFLGSILTSRSLISARCSAQTYANRLPNEHLQSIRRTTGRKSYVKKKKNANANDPEQQTTTVTGAVTTTVDANTQQPATATEAENSLGATSGPVVNANDIEHQTTTGTGAVNSSGTTGATVDADDTQPATTLRKYSW